MIKAVLFDLDNTLLGNDMDIFLPHYFSWCGSFARQYMSEDEFIQTLLIASRAMVENTDPDMTNNDVFWRHFSELSGLEGEHIAAEFDVFYRDEFYLLQKITEYSPTAARIMDACVQRGLQIVIATNPMFPRRAIEARLSWAGVPVTKYPYDLVTTMENMHATKPHGDYYREILEKINCEPAEALMVGDDWERDIEPAIDLGLFTYWIPLPGVDQPAGNTPTAQGTMEELEQCIAEDWLQTLRVSG
jgi:HAD superfamily hydrolase (TIGR01549 family)